MQLTLARRLVDGLLAEAEARATKPLGAIVLDAGGHPVAYARQDGASLFRFDIARAKALGALGMGADTREIAARASASPAFFTSVAIATHGGLALSPGGLLVRDAEGVLVGAVEVSGDTPDVDEACGLAGIRAAGLHHPGASA